MNWSQTFKSYQIRHPFATAILWYWEILSNYGLRDENQINPESAISKAYSARARYWAICLEIAMSRPASSQISPSSSKSPQVINRVRKMHFNHFVVGMLRILTENSSVGTHATIPWLVKTAGGKESAKSKIDNISKGRSFLNFIHPLISELSANSPLPLSVHWG